MNRKSQIILSLFFCVMSEMATAQTYQVTVSNKPFVLLDDPKIAVEEAWTSPEFQVPLGFDFDFFDITSDSLYCFDYEVGGVFGLNRDREDFYMLVPFYASMVDRGYSQDSALSPIHFKTEGSAGDRVFTLEYIDAGLFYGTEDEDGTIQEYIDFQVKLYEASGDIEFHIGPYSVIEDAAILFDPFPGPLIGILAGVQHTVNTGCQEMIMLEGDPLKPGIVTDSIGHLTWPIPENTVYRFSRMGTSVEEAHSQSFSPLLFPNPTSGELHLNENNAKDVIYPIIVRDVHGKQVGHWNNKDEISASRFAAGCYYVIFHTEDEVVTKKLIVLPE